MPARQKSQQPSEPGMAGGAERHLLRIGTVRSGWARTQLRQRVFDQCAQGFSFKRARAQIGGDGEAGLGGALAQLGVFRLAQPDGDAGGFQISFKRRRQTEGCPPVDNRRSRIGHFVELLPARLENYRHGVPCREGPAQARRTARSSDPWDRDRRERQVGSASGRARRVRS
jgi:hypothetical protein